MKKKEFHGKSRTRAYRSWEGMLRRCYKSSDSGYARYGAKGIQVCAQWRDSFSAFLRDMGDPPTKEHTIDRVNNQGNYTPENCRWATKKQQACNTTAAVLITFDGITDSISGWARRIRVSHNRISNRLKQHLPLDEVLSTENMTTTLTKEKVKEIRKYFNHCKGVFGSVKQTAEYFGIGYACCWSIVRNKNWRNVA